MKIKLENKELLTINKALIFSDMTKYEQDKILRYIINLQKEVEVLKKENEDLRKTIVKVIKWKGEYEKD